MAQPLELRVDTLETVLGQFLVSTNVAMLRMERGIEAFKQEMKEFKDETRQEMKEFKDEMTVFKNESEADRKRMNKQWGELANKLGTVVEDIIAPNIPRIAREFFQLDDTPDFFDVRARTRKTTDRSALREFDVIAVYPNHLLVNETKSPPKIEYVNEFIEVLPHINEYFPEYQDKTLIPIFSSLYIPDNILHYLSKHKIYAMGMGDETMTIFNAESFPCS